MRMKCVNSTIYCMWRNMPVGNILVESKSYTGQLNIVFLFLLINVRIKFYV